jgi:hypothetical protein
MPLGFNDEKLMSPFHSLLIIIILKALIALGMGGIFGEGSHEGSVFDATLSVYPHRAG